MLLLPWLLTTVHITISHGTGFRHDSVLQLEKPTGKCLKGFFNMVNSITVMKIAVWLGLVNNMSLPPPRLFVSSSTSCNLLQINGLIHSNAHFHQLALFCVTPRVPIQQRLVITIATAACGALCTLRNKALALKKKSHTH